MNKPNRCKKCNYEWYTRIPDPKVKPKSCPRCKSYDWDKEM